MNPYPNQGGYPNPNMPYGGSYQPSMPTPDFSVNVQQPNFPGAGPGYPQTGAPSYPGMGGNYPNQGYDNNNYGNYGNYGNPSPQNVPNYGNYSNPSPPNAPNYGGGYNIPPTNYGSYTPSNPYNDTPPAPQYQAGYPAQPGYPGQSQPGYPNQSGYPAQPNYQQQYQAPAPTTGGSNLFPNLISGSVTNPVPPSSASSGYYQGSVGTVHYEGTVKPFEPFNPVDDAGKLYKAMKGFGTNETTLIDIICRRTNQQRQMIASCFKTAYGKDLLKDVMSETSGDFHDLLKALLLPKVEFEAHEIREAIAGAGTDESALTELICTKSNAEMLELKSTYKRLFNRDMEKEVRQDASGYFKRLLVSLMNAHRSDGIPDVARAQQLAKELHKAGEKQLGTDEVKFNMIFASESLPQLKLVCDEYYKLTGHDIELAIKREMSGDVEAAFLAIAKMAKSPPAYFAERLYRAMKGAGTKDRTLIRNVTLRCEVDMRDIKVEFQKKYGKTLESFVKGDLSGDYKRAVLCLIGDPSWK